MIEKAWVLAVLGGLIALIVWAFSDEHRRKTAKAPEPRGAGWEEMPEAWSMCRRSGDLVALVHTTARGDWGYSIWSEGRCVVGQSHPAWDRDTAMDEADLCLGG